MRKGCQAQGSDASPKLGLSTPQVIQEKVKQQRDFFCYAQIVSGGGLGAQIVQSKYKACVGPSTPHILHTFIAQSRPPGPPPDTMFAQF